MTSLKTQRCTHTHTHPFQYYQTFKLKNTWHWICSVFKYNQMYEWINTCKEAEHKVFLRVGPLGMCQLAAALKHSLSESCCYLVFRGSHRRYSLNYWMYAESCSYRLSKVLVTVKSLGLFQQIFYSPTQPVPLVQLENLMTIDPYSDKYSDGRQMLADICQTVLGDKPKWDPL